jgi:hypothetical protein
MILNGQLQTSVNGVNIQNGLATQINAKVRCDFFSTYVLDVSNSFNVVGKSFREKVEDRVLRKRCPFLGLILIAVNTEQTLLDGVKYHIDVGSRILPLHGSGSGPGTKSMQILVSI